MGSRWAAVGEVGNQSAVLGTVGNHLAAGEVGNWLAAVGEAHPMESDSVAGRRLALVRLVAHPHWRRLS